MISIRPAGGGDLESLFALIDTIGNFTAAEKELAREVIGDGLVSETSGYQILVALAEGGDLAGFLCYGPIPITVNRWDLYWIAVDPALSRHGVGSRLLEEMERRLGADVHIYVDTSSTPGYTGARAFYERHGYRVACVLPDFYRPGDDKVVYRKIL
ncbi:MAG: GNAT family N-acetyltransferase [Thermodesulfobacteriota bacterium]